MPSHVVISNVPGPQFPLYLAGAKLSLIMGMGPLLHMMGLFHGVFSAVGKITVNFLSCREMLPDPEFYRSCLAESFEELKAASARAKKAGTKADQSVKPATRSSAKTKVKTKAQAKRARARTKTKAGTAAKSAAKNKAGTKTATGAKPRRTAAPRDKS